MANIHMPKEYSDWRDKVFISGTDSITGMGMPSVQRWYWSPGVPASPPDGQAHTNPFRMTNPPLLSWLNRPNPPLGGNPPRARGPMFPSRIFGAGRQV